MSWKEHYDEAVRLLREAIRHQKSASYTGAQVLTEMARTHAMLALVLGLGSATAGGDMRGLL